MGRSVVLVMEVVMVVVVEVMMMMTVVGGGGYSERLRRCRYGKRGNVWSDFGGR